MDFRIDAILPATAAELWTIFFDVKRVAGLIPGCEKVAEVEELKRFSAVLKQKIGPFKLEVPTQITIDSYDLERQVTLKAAGRDQATGTTIDVELEVDLDQQAVGGSVSTKLTVNASMQVAGRLASLGYPIVRKRSEELFAEFERRLRSEIANPGAAQLAAAEPPPNKQSRPANQSKVIEEAGHIELQERLATQQMHDISPDTVVPGKRADRNTELVFLWPRLGINLAAAVAVAHGAVALGQSPWWWLAAPMLGAAASLGQRSR